MKRIELNGNWKFRQAKGEDAWKNAIVPGCVQLDLLNGGFIPDPYYRTNEREIQWIEKEDWEYKTEFVADSEMLNASNAEIVFDGLDTYADVYLNGNLILTADNFYCGWRCNIGKYLKPGKNELRIYFHSPIKKTLPLFEKNGFEYGANNSQPEPKLSVYSRKPGYHFGWDWGPRILTTGIWRPVYIELWNNARIDNVRFVQKSLNSGRAHLQIVAEIISSGKFLKELKLSSSQKSFADVSVGKQLNPGINRVKIDFTIEAPKLWWCRGLGKQHLYELNLELISDGEVEDNWRGRVGLRTLELVEEDDDYGKSFYFKINGKPVFIKGANILPPDYFPQRVSKNDYLKLLDDVASAGMNMVRLWGGAIYEDDLFYDLCDEMGVMVWQDFMFACAMYPADEVMQKRIRAEAEYNIIRLRNHPSLAIWCGNNEIDEGWHTWGWQERYNYSEDTCNLLWGYYKKIFHEILPESVDKLDKGRPYWQSSPKYGFVDDRSRYEGDMHYWGVWFLNHPREKFNEFLPRFMSEYGLQSMPELKTFMQFSQPQDWNLDSDVLKAHQRQYPNPKKNQFLGGYDMLLKYLEREYVVPGNFEHLTYVSQLLQADYLKYAIELHRRSKPYCMGTMYWQLNDVWPVVSWSTVDYYGRWKAAHYAVKKAYTPVLASAADENDFINVYVINDLTEKLEATLSARLMNFYGKVFYEDEIRVVIDDDSSTVALKLDKSRILNGIRKEEALLNLMLIKNNTVIADNNFFFAYTNRLLLPPPKIELETAQAGTRRFIKIASDVFVKNLFIKCENTDGKYSDNYFDLLPNTEKTIEFEPEKEFAGAPKFSLIHYQKISVD
ncbi:beta-mannosidase [Melioribacter roseus P3M-2]|uniref:Beta-mannosidase B n=1 Tax=Melioribacter roseus (strain DSM 23840 / JCM 17771 / VKM B-2668 / P3M-2) TaxID=1191523 RepID=I7A3R6_MELRP|nr:glycoside hydrolase family 2 protein [Melioribacter roseus]AFN74531.1 beta-mannosidase [Melioribacter roseus P3M-2]